MIADAVTLQGDNNLPTIPFNDWTHRKTFWPLLLVTLGDCLFGASIVFAAGLPYKWVFVFSAAACFPIFAVALGSVKRALESPPDIHFLHGHGRAPWILTPI